MASMNPSNVRVPRRALFAAMRGQVFAPVYMMPLGTIEARGNVSIVPWGLHFKQRPWLQSDAPRGCSVYLVPKIPSRKQGKHGEIVTFGRSEGEKDYGKTSFRIPDSVVDYLRCQVNAAQCRLFIYPCGGHDLFMRQKGVSTPEGGCIACRVAVQGRAWRRLRYVPPW